MKKFRSALVGFNKSQTDEYLAKQEALLADEIKQLTNTLHTVTLELNKSERTLLELKEENRKKEQQMEQLDHKIAESYKKFCRDILKRKDEIAANETEIAEQLKKVESKYSNVNQIIKTFVEDLKTEGTLDPYSKWMKLD